MTESESNMITKTPIHFWIIAIISLLWNLIGAMDYVMSQTKNEEYLKAFTPEQLEFFSSFPSWVTASWAIAVWSAVIGSILLLFKTKFATQAFLVSFFAMVITSVHNYGLSNGFEIMGDTFSLVFTAVIFLVALALYLYARAMQKRDVIS